jgi:UDP-GlcNAc:undecaprenyl-phosphate/decaprenyl-phosphate GlcNAc-1-phosphate transferase
VRYWDAVFAFAVAAAAAVLVTPLAAELAWRLGAVDYPRERGLSIKPTPRLGGVAILVGVLIAATIWMPATIHLAQAPHSLRRSGGEVHTWAVLAGAVLIALVGMADDIFDLPPIVKLVGQIVAALIAEQAGVAINDLTIPLIGSFQFPHGGGALALVWLVVLMNVVNFSDGVDGLAAGVCTIDGIAFAIIAFSLQGGGSGAAVMAALTAGASLGFLVHNFPPAKIFMGDMGANLLGYMIGCAAMIGSIKTTASIALVVPLLVLAVPFLDTGFVVAKRLKYRRKPWSADAEHFHHRLARIGFSQRQTVLYLYSWTVMLALVALALHFIPYSEHVLRHGHYYRRFNAGWAVLMALILIGAVAASVYLVYVLEILKFRGLRALQMRSVDPDTSEQQIDEAVAHDIGTGEFQEIPKGPPHGDQDPGGPVDGDPDDDADRR